MLGKVRFDAARSHKETAKMINSDGGSKQQIQQEKKLYSKIKKARGYLGLTLPDQLILLFRRSSL